VASAMGPNNEEEEECISNKLQTLQAGMTCQQHFNRITWKWCPCA